MQAQYQLTAYFNTVQDAEKFVLIMQQQEFLLLEMSIGPMFKNSANAGAAVTVVPAWDEIEVCAAWCKVCALVAAYTA